MAMHPLSGTIISFYVAIHYLCLLILSFFYLVKRKPGKTHITKDFQVAAMSVPVLFFILLGVGMINFKIYTWDKFL